MKEETIAGLIALLILLFTAGVGFLAGWKCAKGTEARKRYRTEHPKYQHSGGERDSS